MKNIYIISILLFGFALNSLAQTKSSREIKGDKQFFIYAFDKAINYYERTKELTTDGQRKLAESYHILGNETESEAIYSNLVASNGKVADDYYKYAMVLKSQKKYDESNQWMEKFATEKPQDLRAKSYTENKDKFSQYTVNNPDFTVRSQSINTASQDFGTSYYNDKVVYASSNVPPKMVKRKYNWNGEPYLDLYVAEIKDGQLENRKKFDKVFKSKMHDGPASFSNNGTFMAYTSNTIKDKTKDKIVELQISFSNLVNEEWSDPVSFQYNNPAYSMGHPYLTEDGKTMYFVSNMPGGFGGNDIYKSTKTGTDQWSAPENLGNTVNTEGDEMFPYFNEKQQILMFTSNGHYGIGGIDIFKAKQNGNSFEAVENLGMPINSEKDDFAFIFNKSIDSGYFSSNRSEGQGGDDIYAFKHDAKVEIKKMISGTVKDKQGKTIPNALVTLLSENEEILATTNSNDQGKFEFPVETDKNYELVGSKDSYKEGTTNASTFGEDEVIAVNLTLDQDEIEEDPTDVKEEDIVVENDLANVAKLKPIYFDFDKSDIRPDAAKELDKIVKVMNKYPNMHVELASHTDCRGTEDYNMTLSENRAKSSVEYVQARISNPSRISGKGKGESKLIKTCACDGITVSNCTPAEHQENRRTEFIIKK